MQPLLRPFSLSSRSIAHLFRPQTRIHPLLSAFPPTRSQSLRRPLLNLISQPSSRAPFTSTPIRHQYRYQRFNSGAGRALAGRVFTNWTRHPHFRYHIAIIVGIGTTFYVSNLEEVPVSKRRRFNCVPSSWESALGAQTYNSILQEYGPNILPESDRRVQMVHRVLERLIPSSGLSNLSWEIHVIDSPETNAFVIPGGKVFVFSGILPICRDESGLAAVLGHEIAHTLAHHQAEQLSSRLPLTLLTFASAIALGSTGLFAPDQSLYLSNTVISLLLDRPWSRAQESEADYIGLMMMAQSCYDPAAAVRLWEDMGAANCGKEPPAWMSTHPSSEQRRGKIGGWLAEAEGRREESDCRSVLPYAEEFRSKFQQVAW
ncbi:hypothetical protein LTS18_000071 [Coniosporium uncinatum]|uniref:Uncharacterized protein n=1 Tax=Coniosporium uncinatum TaxID=93489 RepID=A0ACC3DE03_9PEZI|nr:hypothetical protein LTS18_000071 [Coniosporium uncinatum]